MSSDVIVDFNRSSMKNGIHIKMPSCWKAIIPVDKISLIRQEEYSDIDTGDNILETYIHLSEPVGVGKIERVRLPNTQISDLQPFIPKDTFISLLTDSDIEPDSVVPCLISKQHIDDVKDKNGSVIQVNAKDSVVFSLCLATYQMTSETETELDKLFSKETDQYGWRKRMPVPA